MPRRHLSSRRLEEYGGVKEAESSIIVKRAVKVLKTAEKSNKMLGVFCSAAGGPHQAIYRAIACGGRSASFFIKNRRRWESPKLDSATINVWFETVKNTNFPLNQVVPHGTFLLNPASPEPLIRERSRENMLDDCKRCEKLGITLYCFHPGSTLGLSSKQKALKNVAEAVNYIHKRTSKVILLVENMPGSGYTIGNTFEDLRNIISLIKDKSRIGICLDTAHLFLAGYDIRTKAGYNKVIDQFERKIGFQYLKALHINDSKRELGSMVDRHANIGQGYMGLKSFIHIMNDSRFDNLPMILETPAGAGYPNELLALYKLEKPSKTKLTTKPTRTYSTSKKDDKKPAKRSSSKPKSTKKMKK